jgi:hypothetical protein
VQVPELTKAGSSGWFEVPADGEKIGTIALGRGSNTWYGGKRPKGIRTSRSKVDELMDRHCYGEVG